jgi:hypothetical protein
MRSTSMNLSRLKSGNGLPLRWLTSMGSPTSMCRPSHAERPWTRAGCTWTTARSSTSARSINLAHNPLSSTCPTPRCPDVPDDRRRDSQCGVICARPCATRRVVDARAPTLRTAGPMGVPIRRHGARGGASRTRLGPARILTRTRPDHPIGLRAISHTSKARTHHGVIS